MCVHGKRRGVVRLMPLDLALGSSVSPEKMVGKWFLGLSTPSNSIYEFICFVFLGPFHSDWLYTLFSAVLRLVANV